MIGSPHTLPKVAWIALGAVLFTFIILSFQAVQPPAVVVFTAGIVFAEIADKLVSKFVAWGDRREQSADEEAKT